MVIVTRFIERHTDGIAIMHQLRGVCSVDVVHRDPELIVELTAIVHTHDVEVKQLRRQVRLTDEPLTELASRRLQADVQNELEKARSDGND